MRSLFLILFTICALVGADRTFPLTDDPNWSVYDGDTATVNIDLGFDISKRISLRIDGIDTPEMHTQSKAAAEVAKKFTQYWIAKNKGNIQVRIVKYRGKYGRPIGDLVTESGSLGQYLLDQGVAVKYGEKAKYTGKLLKEIAAKEVPVLKDE